MSHLRKPVFSGNTSPWNDKQLLKLMLWREWGVCTACDLDLEHSQAQENLYFVLSVSLGKNTFSLNLTQPNHPPPFSCTHAVLTKTMLLFWTSPYPCLPVGDKLVCCLFFPPKLLIGHLWQSCAAAPGEILPLWVVSCCRKKTRRSWKKWPESLRCFPQICISCQYSGAAAGSPTNPERHKDRWKW